MKLFRLIVIFTLAFLFVSCSQPKTISDCSQNRLKIEFFYTKLMDFYGNLSCKLILYGDYGQHLSEEHQREYDFDFDVFRDELAYREYFSRTTKDLLLEVTHSNSLIISGNGISPIKFKLTLIRDNRVLFSNTFVLLHTILDRPLGKGVIYLGDKCPDYKVHNLWYRIEVR